jgi:predicted F0F1-ATPase subunit
MTKQNNISKKAPYNNLALTSIGWELALPIFGGLLTGYFIDRRLDTGFTFTLILLIVGVLIGYYSLYKYIELEILRKKASENRKEKKGQIS